jgi:hypothetical protein
MENKDINSNEDSTENNLKFWIQDNMRIIISILIVVLIAGGIYSYSRRTEDSGNLSDSQIISSENELEDEEDGEELDENIDGEENQVAQQEEASTEQTETSKQETSSVASSQETENSFIETAVAGDSKTKLARKALANYLEKNPDSALTAEHKIYIEDYMRKHVQHNDRVTIGTSVEFSKDLIKSAVESSKSLNERQLQNLHQYVVRVPSLT